MKLAEAALPDGLCVADVSRYTQASYCTDPIVGAKAIGNALLTGVVAGIA